MRMKKRNWILAMALVLMLGLTGCGGSGEEYEEGRIGDVMHDQFFDFTVNSVFTCDTYEGYTPEAGRQLLVAELTVKNTFNETIPMFDTDFQAQWNDKEDQDNAFSNPIETIVSGDQMEAEYNLAVDEERTGLLIFEVPEDLQDFSIVYLEEFDDDTTGNLYQVYFTAKDAGTTV